MLCAFQYAVASFSEYDEDAQFDPHTLYAESAKKGNTWAECRLGSLCEQGLLDEKVQGAKGPCDFWLGPALKGNALAQLALGESIRYLYFISCVRAHFAVREHARGQRLCIWGAGSALRWQVLAQFAMRIALIYGGWSRDREGAKIFWRSSYSPSYALTWIYLFAG